MKKIIALCLTLLVCFTVNIQLANAAQPTVTTGVATLITTDSAKLNGTVNPNSVSTTWYFEYGLTASYGLKTDALNAGSGTTSVAVSADLLGCTSGTTYHFRLVATNSAGTILGCDKIFTTTVFATTQPIPDTGISKCYNDTAEIPCSTAGQDFYGQVANYSINPMSYTKLDATGNVFP